MSPAASYRGQPLVALVLLLGGWVTARAIVWESANDAAASLLEQSRLAAAAGDREPAALREGAHVAVPARDSALPRPQFAPAAMPALPHYPLPLEPLRPAMRSAAMPPPAPVPVQVSAGHQLLWMAALSRMPLPPAMLAQLSRPPAPPPLTVPVPAADRASRWSADGWLLLRRGGTVSTANGLVPPTYGASQIGAVVRFRLAPQSEHRPALYLRSSAALNGSREREAAFGISARPIAGLPVAVAAEARLNGQPGATRGRPAAFAYTELPPVTLPMRARAEFYGQAGYVGGNFASAFADGQLRIDRHVADLGRGELRAGGGVWGGAQKGASRLDIGPTATLGMPLGGTAGARLGLDWRFRVTGNAEPSSGPALTLSAGF